MGCENRLAFSFTTLKGNEVPVNVALIEGKNLDGLEFEVYDQLIEIGGREGIRVSGQCRRDQELPLLQSLVGLSNRLPYPIEFEDLTQRRVHGPVTEITRWSVAVRSLLQVIEED